MVVVEPELSQSLPAGQVQSDGCACFADRLQKFPATGKAGPVGHSKYLPAVVVDLLGILVEQVVVAVVGVEYARQGLWLLQHGQDISAEIEAEKRQAEKLGDVGVGFEDAGVLQEQVEGQVDGELPFAGGGYGAEQRHQHIDDYAVGDDPVDVLLVELHDIDQQEGDVPLIADQLVKSVGAAVGDKLLDLPAFCLEAAGQVDIVNREGEGCEVLDGFTNWLSYSLDYFA